MPLDGQYFFFDNLKCNTVIMWTTYQKMENVYIYIQFFWFPYRFSVISMPYAKKLYQNLLPIYIHIIS